MTTRPATTQLVLALATLLAGNAIAQDSLAIRIETREEGVHRIPGEALKAHFPLDRIAPDRLALSRDGIAVPIEVFGASDGHFDPSDEIIFFAEKPRGRHSATETYVLSDRGKPARLRPGSAPPGASDAANEAQVIVEHRTNAVFDQLATVRQDVIRGPVRSPWFSAELSPRSARRGGEAGGKDPSTASFPVLLDPRPLKGLPARIRIDVFGAMANGVPQKLAINVNGTELPTQTWDTPLEQKLLVTVPPDVLRRETVIRLTNLSEAASYTEPGNELMTRRRNDLLVSGIAVIYDAQLAGPSVSGTQLVFHVAAGSGGQKPRLLKFEQRQREGYLIVEPKAGRLWKSPLVEVPGDRDVTLAVCALGGAILPPPEAIQPLRPTREHVTGAGGDYVIVTTSDLKPAVAMLAEHRRSEGFTPVVLEARELYDAFTHGAYHPAAIQRFLAAATLNWQKKPRYLLLAGDADLDCNFVNQRECVPSWLVMTDYNGMTATDALHGDVDQDGLADIPVGRIPVRTREAFLDVARRIIALETNPPPGAWRRRLTFFAGEGRFGEVVDRLLENEAKSAIAAIPADFDVRMTYGSPHSDWYWPADDFNAHLIRSFNEGALVFTYIGHGSPDAFDHVAVGSRVYPILTANDVGSLANGGRAPVMAIIACSTGRYDDPKRNRLAEQMFLKDGGPIAVIAASRISHPYPNALFGKGIAKPFFEGSNRVGDAFRMGQLGMIESAKTMGLVAGAFLSKAVSGKTLVRDHAWIYNLLGDPAQRVPFPARFASIEAPESAKAGTAVAIKATTGGAATGVAHVSIEAARGTRKIPAPETAPTNAGASEESPVAMLKARHDAANDHAIARGRVDVAGGEIAATLTIPEGTPPGTYSVVVFLEGGAGAPDAMGARKIRIE